MKKRRRRIGESGGWRRDQQLPEAKASRRDKTTEEIAGILDLDRGTILRWCSDGLPHGRAAGRRGNLYDVGEVQAWMTANGRTGAVGRPLDAGSDQLKALKIRKEAALVEKYERENKVEAGKLIDAEAERRRDLQKIAVVRNRLCGLGALLAAQLEGLGGADRQAAIDGAVNEILADFAKP